MTAARYDPVSLRAAATLLDAEPVAFSALPDGLAFDEDLQRNIAARYGEPDDSYRFEPIELPVSVLLGSLPADTRELARQITVRGAAFYSDLDAAWRRAYRREIAAYRREHRRVNPFDIDCDYPDGERRRRIVERYVAELRAGRPLTPIVIDLHNLDGGPMPGVDLLDGYHRFAAHLLAEAHLIRCLSLLPE